MNLDWTSFWIGFVAAMLAIGIAIDIGTVVRMRRK